MPRKMRGVELHPVDGKDDLLSQTRAPGGRYSVTPGVRNASPHIPKRRMLRFVVEASPRIQFISSCPILLSESDGNPLMMRWTY